MTIRIPVDSEIVLELLQEENAEALFSLVDAHRAYMRRWLPWVDAERSPRDTRNFIQFIHQQYHSREGFQTGIWYHGHLVGVIGYHKFDWANRSTSIGYWLAEDFQGRGIMTRSCRAMVDYAFSSLRLHRVEIRCAVENAKSRAIPERLGFTIEGVAREAEWLYDHYEDLVVYAMLEDQWNETNKAKQ
jgi:ribosomal-protein-serine acetyltransferase